MAALHYEWDGTRGVRTTDLTSSRGNPLRVTLLPLGLLAFLAFAGCNRGSTGAGSVQPIGRERRADDVLPSDTCTSESIARLAGPHDLSKQPQAPARSEVPPSPHTVPRELRERARNSPPAGKRRGKRTGG